MESTREGDGEYVRVRESFLKENASKFRGFEALRSKDSTVTHLVGK